MYIVQGSILSDDSEILTDVEVQEINAFGFPALKTKTDQDGRFKLPVGSADNEIQISKFGYFSQRIKASDFNIDGLIYLTPAVEIETTKKESNALLYGVVAVSVFTAIYFALREPEEKKPLPKQVKIA